MDASPYLYTHARTLVGSGLLRLAKHVLRKVTALPPLPKD